MVLIEYYTERHIENISTCLRLKPEKLYLVGTAEEAATPLNRYKAILKKRKLKTKAELYDVVGADFEELYRSFTTLLAPKEQYVVDLSGGDATAVMALGAVYANLPQEKQKDIQILRYDEDLENLIDCLHDNKPLPQEPVYLTVKELIQLHGGVVLPNSDQPSRTFSAKQLEPLWEMASDPKTEWNQNLATLIQFQSYNTHEDGILLELDSLVGKISDFSDKEQQLRSFLKKLDKKGIIEDHSSFDYLEYRYTDPVYRYCLEKAGNVLEMKVLLEARELQVNGKPYFNDCHMSVSIDWDGVLYPNRKRAETRNEIDVVLMRGMIPTFISCKNGTIEEVELYKLYTVAERFGGPHVQKLLLATNPGAVSRATSQRAWDMDVLLVSDIATMSRQDWRYLFTHIEEELP